MPVYCWQKFKSCILTSYILIRTLQRSHKADSTTKIFIKIPVKVYIYENKRTFSIKLQPVHFEQKQMRSN